MDVLVSPPLEGDTGRQPAPNDVLERRLKLCSKSNQWGFWNTVIGKRALERNADLSEHARVQLSFITVH